MSLDISLYRDGYEVFSANITHNLNTMAEKAGIYEALWRPYRIKSGYNKNFTHEEEWKFENKTVVLAKEIIPLLEKGFKRLKLKPKYYQKFNSSNGWGVYEHFLPFVEECLEACKQYPEAVIKSDR